MGSYTKKPRQYNFEQAFNDYLNMGFVLDETEDTVKRISSLKEKMKCHCKKHNTSRELSWENIKSGRVSCPNCRKENGSHNYSIEEKINIINNTGLKYISGDLTRILNPVTVECENGYRFDRCFNNIKRGNIKCEECNGVKRRDYWTIDTCQQWINDNNIGYTVYNVIYNGEKVKVFLNCNCGHNSYWVDWNHFYHNGTRCKQCYYKSNNKLNWTLDLTKEYIKDFGFEMIDESLYKSCHSKFPAKDNLGFIYMISIHYLRRNRTVFSLWKNNPYAMDNIRLFCKLYRPDYEPLFDKYNGNKTIHRWRYLGECLPDDIDRDFDLSFGSFVNSGCGHPMLSKSKLEAKCSHLLNLYNIEYETQKRFADCKDKSTLPFDFYIEINNKKYCIETDGSQHYNEVPQWGGLEALLYIQEHDKIKTNYCKDNDIKLIRISYKQFNEMENILVKELELSSSFFID